MLIKRRLDKYILMYSYNRIFSSWKKKWMKHSLA